MHVLHVFKDYLHPGGVETHVRQLARGMDDVRSTVLTTSRSRRRRREMDGQVVVLREPEYGRPTSTPVTPTWASLLRTASVDLIHFHSPNPFGELAFLASRTRTPMVASLHADIVGRRLTLPFFVPFQQRFLGKARRIIVGSDEFLRTSSALRAHSGRAVVVPYGIDAELWRCRPDAADAIRDRFAGPIVLYLGRLAFYKGLDVLLASMRSVDATLVVAGDGPLRGELESRTDELGVRHRVVFAGRVRDDERAAYYHASDVFCLASTSSAESFGISMMEAMACGTPAVCTDVGTGTVTVNAHGCTGLVVAPNDPGALASALNGLLADGQRRRDMGAAAARRMRSRFPLQATLDGVRAVYDDVLSS